MPSLPARFCRYGVCDNKIYGSEVYCEPHKKEKAKLYDDSRGNSHQRGYNKQWRSIREAKLTKNPFCEVCTAIAVLVHHIDENPRNNHMSNLLSACTACHSKIHGVHSNRGR